MAVSARGRPCSPKDEENPFKTRSKMHNRNNGGALRLALTRAEAAASLSMSIDSFERYVQPDLKLIRPSRLVLVPVRELERWIELHAERTLAS
jgi:hypothetical protein